LNLIEALAKVPRLIFQKSVSKRYFRTSYLPEADNDVLLCRNSEG